MEAFRHSMRRQCGSLSSTFTIRSFISHANYMRRIRPARTASFPFSKVPAHHPFSAQRIALWTALRQTLRRQPAVRPNRSHAAYTVFDSRPRTGRFTEAENQDYARLFSSNAPPDRRPIRPISCTAPSCAGFFDETYQACSRRVGTRTKQVCLISRFRRGASGHGLH